MNDNMKYAKWTLDTLTNVKKLKTIDIEPLAEDLQGRLVFIFQGADELIGATFMNMKLGMAITDHPFPMIGESGIIKKISVKKKTITFHYFDIYEKKKVYAPNSTEMVFIMEKDSADKKRLCPEYAWRPE